MASPRDLFRQGVLSFRSGKSEEALRLFSQAINLGLSDPAAFDSRAAAFEKLGQFKDALKDAKKGIDLSPSRWQGYARSARLFMKLGKYSSASRMVLLAIERAPRMDRKRIQELQTLQTEISSANEQYQLTLSRTFYHFGKLPVEIAINIFRLVVGEEHTRVITLTQVCKEWRSAILDTPSFWATLVLSSAHPARKAKVWRKRSKGKLLSLSLAESSSSGVLEEFRDMSFPFLGELKLNGWDYSRLVKALPSLDLDALASLQRFEATRCQLSRGHIPKIHLRTLTLVESTIDFSKVADDLSELQDFAYGGTLSPHHWEHLLWLLHCNSGLLKLSLDIKDGQGTDEGTTRELPSLIHLRHLTSLQFLSYNRGARAVFPRLRVPELRTFHLFSAYPPTNGILEVLLLSECAKRLTELRFRLCTIAAHEVVSVLRETSALEILEYSRTGSNQANDILEALAGSYSPLPPTKADDMLCPRLREIDFSECLDVKSGPLVRLVKLHLPSDGPSGPGNLSEGQIAPLDAIVVDGCPGVDPDILPWLRNKVKVVKCVYATKKNAGWKR